MFNGRKHQHQILTGFHGGESHTLVERVTELRAQYVVFAPAKAVCLVASQPFNQF